MPNTTPTSFQAPRAAAAHYGTSFLPAASTVATYQLLYESDGVLMRKRPPSGAHGLQLSAVVQPPTPRVARGSLEGNRQARQLLELVNLFPHERRAIVARATQLAGVRDLRAELQMACSGPTAYRPIEASSAFERHASTIISACEREIQPYSSSYYALLVRVLIGRGGPTLTSEQMRALANGGTIRWGEVRFN